MTTATLQTVAVGIGGLALLATSVSLTRRGLLSLRYGLGWMAASTTVVVAALLLWLVAPLAGLLRMTPTGLMLFSATSCGVALALQLSVSLSGQQSAIRDLTEATALLEARLQHAEFESRQRAEARTTAPRAPGSAASRASRRRQSSATGRHAAGPSVWGPTDEPRAGG
jgi:hypothetical protein